MRSTKLIQSLASRDSGFSFCREKLYSFKHLESVIVHDSPCQSSAMKMEVNDFCFALCWESCISLMKNRFLFVCLCFGLVGREDVFFCSHHFLLSPISECYHCIDFDRFSWKNRRILTSGAQIPTP